MQSRLFVLSSTLLALPLGAQQRPAPAPPRAPAAESARAPAPTRAPRPVRTPRPGQGISDAYFEEMLAGQAMAAGVAEEALRAAEAEMRAFAFAQSPMPPVPSLPDWPHLAEMPHLPELPDVHDMQLRADEAVHAAQSAFDRLGVTRAPRAAWAPQDAADSLYRAARELLNRGEYGRAAQAFRDIPQRYPNSAYAADALYWRAWALYRIGGTNELREALASLDSQKSRYPNARIQADASSLATRIRGVLASRGDREAAAEIARTASGGTQTCDREEQMVQIEAMNALSRTDPENVGTLIERVLARKDECAVPLRKSAVFLLGGGRAALVGFGQQPSGAGALRDSLARQRAPSMMSTLINVARSDPSTEVRAEAINVLGRLPGDEGLALLEELVRTSDDQRIQRAAVQALVRHPSARARQAVRTLLERKDVPERLRSEALSAFDRERTSAEDIAWLRTYYANAETPAMKQRVLSTLSRVGGPEVDQWFVSLLRDEEESSEVRSVALRRIGKTLPVADLARLYDSASQRRLRQEIISLLANRPENEATDKLIDIVKNGTDANLRTQAISALANKKDERARALLLEIINK